jgi:S1-C subfamily serine protease
MTSAPDPDEMTMDDAPAKTPDRRNSRLRRFLTAVRKTAPYFAGMLTAVGALYVYNLIIPPKPPLTPKEVNDTIASVLASATPRAAFSADVYQVIQPSLVLIEAHAPHVPKDDSNSLGSGVVISDQGAILTSLHVVAGADKIEVIFADGTKSNAVIAVSQPEIDIAVLNVDQLPAIVVPAIMGNPKAVRVGDEAFVVGNPFGLYSSMSAGIVSGFDRTFKSPDSDFTMKGMIQIDTAVNPGNSGGPLLNRYGEVIGIVTGLTNPTGEDFFIGIGFAVPITTAGGAAGSPPY